MVQFETSEDKKVIEIPIKVYKNVYEANTLGEKPLFLTDAEKNDLKGINYVKVTVDPTGKANNKDSKIYYVNPKAWVNIPEIDINNSEEEPKLVNWLSDSQAGEAFDFKLRHKFTKDTTITAQFNDQKPKKKNKIENPLTQDKTIVPDIPSIPDTPDKAIVPDIPSIPDTPDKPGNPHKPSESDDNKPNPSNRQKPEDSDDSEPDFQLTPGDDNPNYPKDLEQEIHFIPKDNDPNHPVIDKDNNFEYSVIADSFNNQKYTEVNKEANFQNKVEKNPTDNSYFKEVGYIQGFNGNFRPKDGLTRAEAAQILANVLIEDGYKYQNDFKISYKDIGEAWYTKAIKIVSQAKVFSGYNDGNFKPQKKITRNEWISTLKRFQELGNSNGNHMNLKTGHWAISDVEAAYKEGWLEIYEEGKVKYEGDKFITREEVVSISNKAFKRFIDKDYIAKNGKNLINFKDVNENMWSYADIICASNTFLYQGNAIKAHVNKDSKNSFNIDTNEFEIKQKKFERVLR